MRAAAVVLLLTLPALAGCLDFLDAWTGPSYSVSRTELAVGPNAWNRDGTFLVRTGTDELVEVRIEARGVDDRVLQASGPSNRLLDPVILEIPDGTWTVTYFLDGRKHETFRNARIDSTPPTIINLEALGRTQTGDYTIGRDAVLEPGARLVVSDQRGGFVSNTLPVPLLGLPDGIHAYDLTATDPAGNRATWTVQVVVGSAAALPDGKHALGIVARYTTAAQLWDLSALSSYATPEAARAAVGQRYLGSGKGIDPNDSQVQQIVAQTVTLNMTTGQAALALYRWMFDNLEYTEDRLEQTDLLEPGQTINHGGGVCRDLAGLYVSLLRAARIPARLVTGYLAGNVNGFHAWVEFYGGQGHGPTPWVPVDVSPIDGPYDEFTMMQAFGIRRPDYLRLRDVTETQEQGNWSNAASLSYRAPPNRNPVFSFEEILTIEFQEKRHLCANPDTYVRSFVVDTDSCSGARRPHIPDFPSRIQNVLDYGVDARQAQGSTLEVSFAFPQSAVAPDEVQILMYGASFARSDTTGRASAERSF